MATAQLEKTEDRIALEAAPPGQGPAGGATPAVPRVKRGRRRFIVDWTSQLRAGLSGILVVGGLLLILNMTLFQLSSATTSGIAEYAPEAGPAMSGADRMRTALTLVCSIVFFAGFAALRMVETQRIYGASLNLRRRIGEIAGGDYSVEVALRKDDRLHDLAESVNEAARGLRERTRDEIETLDAIARRIDSAQTRGDVDAIKTELARIAAAKRARVG